MISVAKVEMCAFSQLNDLWNLGITILYLESRRKVEATLAQNVRDLCDDQGLPRAGAEVTLNGAYQALETAFMGKALNSLQGWLTTELDKISKSPGRP